MLTLYPFIFFFLILHIKQKKIDSVLPIDKYFGHQKCLKIQGQCFRLKITQFSTICFIQEKPKKIYL
jgi:hypothetical protein